MGFPPIQYLLLAVAVGAVVGLVNEYRKISGARIFLGLRTSIFTAMLGFVFAALSYMGGFLMIAVGFLAITVVAATIYIERARVLKSLGATTYVSMLLVFASGLLVGLGYYVYGVVISVLVAVLSFYKTQLLNAISKIRREELLAILNLLLISAVMLPLLPDKFIGPYRFFNPFQFWLTVTIVAIIFFIQYVTLRASSRGLFAFTLIGGLVSSTTVTLSIINLSNELGEESRQGPLAINVLISNLPLAIVQVAAALYFSTGSGAPLTTLWPSIVVLGLGLIGVAIVKRSSLNPGGLEPPSTPLPFMRIIEFAGLLFTITAIAKVVGEAAPHMLPLAIGASALGNALGAVIAVGILYDRHIVGASQAGLLALIALTAGVAEKAPLALLSRSGAFRKVVIAGSLALAAVSALPALLVL
ncbi:MAG: DUF4010 domain-containing protein [Acidilobus sp.]